MGGNIVIMLSMIELLIEEIDLGEFDEEMFEVMIFFMELMIRIVFLVWEFIFFFCGGFIFMIFELFFVGGFDVFMVV